MNIEQLNALRVKIQNEQQADKDTVRVVVGMATCGIAAGARPVFEALQSEVEKAGLKNVKIIKTGCVGVCRLEPIVEVYVPGEERVTYVKMDPEKAQRVVSEHLVGQKVAADLTIAANQ